MNKNILSLGALAAAGTLFLGANIVSNSALRGVRVDLTENKLYTLSQGSRNIASSLDEPITLKLYYAREQATDAPDIKSFFTRVSEMLAEYALASKGKIKVEIIDPKPFSDEEDAAVEAGLASIPTGRGADRLYFGLVATNAVGKQEVIPLFAPQREEFLEYDLTRVIYQLSEPAKRTVGLWATSLPMEGMQQNPMMTGGGMPPWQILTQMRNFFDVKKLTPDDGPIPADVQVLMLVHPKSLSDKSLYEIDQFVLRGGRLIVFVDPWCQADFPPGINPAQAMGLPRNSNLPKLFDAWGIELVDGKFAADRNFAIRLPAGPQNRQEIIPYVNYISLRNEGISKNDAVTDTLQTINVGSAGVIAKKPGADITFEPLLQTSPESMLIDTSKVQFTFDPKGLLADFAPGNKPLTIAARVSGRFKSAFPDGDPAAVEGAPERQHIQEAREPANVIVVADADMLHDRFWVQESRIGNILLGIQAFSNNGDFVITALDNLSGSSDLMSVRARGKFSRPFDRVEKIRKDAEQKFLAKEQELQNRLKEAQDKLSELVSKQAPQGGMIILTPEQQAEIDQTKKDVLAYKKQLREVNHQLRADIERLGSRIAVVNVAAMPVLVGIAALGLSAYRVGRRRADRRAGARN